MGCELAWWLSILGRTVFLVDILPFSEWLSDDHPTNRFVLLESLDEMGVHILDDAEITEVSGKDKYIRVKREDIEYKISVDDIVLAAGYKKSGVFVRELQTLKGTGELPEIYEIGDCVEVRDIHWAVREGYEVGVRL